MGILNRSDNGREKKELLEQFYQTRKQVEDTLELIKEVRARDAAFNDLSEEEQADFLKVAAALEHYREWLHSHAALNQLDSNFNQVYKNAKKDQTIIEIIKQNCHKQKITGDYFEETKLIRAYSRTGSSLKDLKDFVDFAERQGVHYVELKFSDCNELYEKVTRHYRSLTHFKESLEGDEGKTNLLNLKNQLDDIATEIKSAVKIIEDTLFQLSKQDEEQRELAEAKQFESDWRLNNDAARKELFSPEYPLELDK